MESIWKETVELPSRPGAAGEYLCDVAVIGAGMTGILTAYFLGRQGMRVMVLEADRIAAGQTGSTTAKITSQHGLMYHELIRTVGEERARLYVRANEEAIGAYEDLITEHGIRCGFERLPSYLYSRTRADVLEQEARAARRLGVDAVMTHETRLPFLVASALRFPGQAQFHPLEFLREITKGMDIYEHSRVRRVQGNRLWTDEAVVTAKSIVFATHYPIRNVPGFYFLRQHQERSYVLAWENDEPLGGMYYSVDEGGLSLRSSGGALLLGGGSRRTGKHMADHPYDFLERQAEKYFPGGRALARWSAQDCMPHDGIPFIGRYSHFTKDWYVATGYRKWGMSTAMAAARLLSDMIAGKENPYARGFTPQRLHWSGAGNFCRDAGESVKGLTGGLFHRPRCTHMGCRLHWNREEQTWECPCHGSRFDAEGHVLCEPAQRER